MPEQLQFLGPIRIQMNLAGVPCDIPVSIEDGDNEAERVTEAIAFYKSQGFTVPGDGGATNSGGGGSSRYRQPSGPRQGGSDDQSCPKHGSEKIKENSKGLFCAFTVSKKPGDIANWREWTNDEGYARWSCNWKPGR